MRPDVAPFHHADTGTWSYVVADPATRAAAIIDPVLDFDAKSARTHARFGAEAARPRAARNALHVRWLLETHAHADHLVGCAVAARTAARSARSPSAAASAQTQRSFAPVFEFGDDVAAGRLAVRPLVRRRTTRSRIGDIDATVIAAPGPHAPIASPTCIGDALFTGDTLFMPDAGTARCDFPNARRGDAVSLDPIASTRCPTTRACSSATTTARTAARSPAKPPSARRSATTSMCATDTSEAEYVALRQARDATLPMPALILPSLQVNLRAGALPPPSGNGVRYLRIPLDRV